MNLTVDRVSKSFGNKSALTDISLEFTTGVYGILGANGSGKTTFMRIVASVMKPSSGKVLLNGQDIAALDHQYRELIGYLPQQVGMYPNFTAEKFLSYIAALKGLSRTEAQAKVNEVLELVKLSDHRKEKVGKFSGGMTRRIGIAQALLNDPQILIVDEPTAGLDPKERIRFRNLLSQISADRIVLLSTHIVSDIELIAKEILVLKGGRLIRKDTPRELLKPIEGKVWSLLVDETGVSTFQAKYRVEAIARIRDQFQLRIISETKPHPDAVNEDPNLEDLYLHYFDEEVVV
ncbi:ABC transporter ATP-binding protein [Paenibacillus mesophilus]|uniref:ABC transporter ATP-binding protein n=1 Tax=Paenibacillus mesophilus TaxID=2582849 RepID=UPI00110D30A4|nr:ABC transporter ATP-binding protein [Paenibacillus mesophilus]TMV52338.1 ABC transporter ATP-binding protein [Paenibacillus mesophilus]